VNAGVRGGSCQALEGVYLLDTLHEGRPGTIGVYLVPTVADRFVLIEAGPGSTFEAVVAAMPPTLVIASTVDGVIPFAESEAMVQLLREVEDGPPVEFHTIDVRHGYFPGRPEFWQAVDDYLAGLSQA
jgi:predicted esterase